MKTDLIIVTTRARGAFPRIIGTIERRGFAIIGINTLGDGDEGCSVHLRVEGGERSATSLVRHLDKLVDVRRTELLGAPLLPEHVRHVV